MEQVNAAYASLPKVDGEYEFTEVVQLDSTFTKDALYRNAKLFFANAFNSAKEVLQYDDRAEGKVIGKGNVQSVGYQMSFLVLFSETRTTNFTLEIFCKEGKYKYRIYSISSDVRTVASGGSSPDNVSNTVLTLDMAYTQTTKGVSKKMDRSLFFDTVSKLNGLADQIKQAMNKKSKDDF